MMQTPSILGADYAVCYGFYDSGPGFGSLTNQDQAYVYVTGRQSDWMGTVIEVLRSQAEGKPFGFFALPGAHDAGMSDLTCVDQILENPLFQQMLEQLLGLPVTMLALPVIRRAVINFAFTQKDTMTTMLDLGIRYFDFRPGYCYKKLVPGIYHQHGFIPGYPYDAFLRDVFTWLAGHPTEIVVIRLSSSGFTSEDAMKPDAAVLVEMVAAAQKTTGTEGKIVTGNRDDLGRTYADLIAARKRLLFLNNDAGTDDASAYDSYSDDAYKTTDVRKIIKALDGMTESGQADHDLTVLQLQGTASATGGGIFTSVATMSDASSPLMSTKPGFDHATYAWLQDNVPVPGRFRADQLMVFLNDFCDNALVDYGFGMSFQRGEGTA
jgi:hypothetical protein